MEQSTLTVMQAHPSPSDSNPHADDPPSMLPSLTSLMEPDLHAQKATAQLMDPTKMSPNSSIHAVAYCC